MPMDEWQYADALADLAASHGSLWECGHVGGAEQHGQLCSWAPNAACCQCSTYHQAIQQQQHDPTRSQADAKCTASALTTAYRQQRHQCQLLVMPDWLKLLAQQLSGSILSQPDTFR